MTKLFICQNDSLHRDHFDKRTAWSLVLYFLIFSPFANFGKQSLLSFCKGYKPKKRQVGIKFIITDCSNFDKRRSGAHFVSFLFQYYCTLNLQLPADASFSILRFTMNEFNSTLGMNKLTALFFRKTQSIPLLNVLSFLYYT